MKISPSILAGDLIDLRRTLESLDADVVDLIHLDVMDGHFVPQLSFGEGFAKSVKSATSIPLDVHLMVSNPEVEVPKYFALNPHNITFHVEATNFAIRLAGQIREQGIKAGVALNPGTPLTVLEPLWDHIDLILLMSVEPGFYGQSFIPSTLPRLEKLRELRGERPILVEVDGGVSTANIRDLETRGADLCVAGSACFKTPDVNGNVQGLKTAAG